MNFTPEQQHAISAKGKIIVSAAAGSGKTAVMIERLVSLILSGTDVRQILALTFTNKAAAQMRDRARSALSARLVSASGEERERLRDQLAALPSAEIGTIHAFCGRLVRTNFYLADVDAGFRIISPDDADGATLQSRAAELVFEGLYEEKDTDFFGLLSVYFRKKKDKRLKTLIRTLYASVRELGNYRELLGEEREMFDAACAFLAHNYQKTAEFLIEKLEGMREFFGRVNPKAMNVLNDVVAAAGALVGQDLFGMRSVALTPLKISIMPRMTKADGEELKNLKFLSGASKKIKDLYAELQEYADEETERERNAAAERTAHALCRLLLRFDDEYTRLKREANVLDYNDLEQLALKVLSDGEALADLKKRYTHIFVDEYQDVNRVQERILSLLAGDEVFFVGDSKQAIYGFRGSSSAFFEEKRREFRPLGGDISLNRNFRSGTAVLDAVGRVFSPILKNYEPMEGGDRYHGAAGEVRFHMVESVKEEPLPRGIYSVKEHRGAEKTDEIATYVANLIEEEIASEFFDVDIGAWRKVEFSDIAVLVRKHSGEMEAVAAELERRDIPVSSASNVNICTFFEARLLIDWLSLLDNAEQDAPLCTALLSAVGGFSEDELACIRLARPNDYFFRDACRAYAYAEGSRGEKLAEKLRNFFTYLKDFRMRAQALTAADVLAGLLSAGLETQIAAGRNGALRLSRIRRLLAEAEGKSVHGFLADLKARDFEIDYAGGGGEEAVRLITMHASKGLEFPVVILADLDVPFHGADRGDVLFTEQFRFAPYAYDLEKKRIYSTVSRRASELLQETEERVGETNLLYVAMTRAKFRLHMLFQGKGTAIDPVFAGRLSDFVPLSGMGDLFVPSPARREAAPPRQALAGNPDPALVENILSVYRLPYPYADSSALPLKSSATEIMRENREEGAHTGGGGPVHTKEEGLAYHAFLEHVRFGRDAGEELRRMREEKLLSTDELALLDEAKLRQILSLPCLAGIQNKRMWREQTFLTLLPADEVLPTDAKDEILFQGAIDLLVEDEGGFTVIDYKFSGRGDEHIRETYAPQIRLYKKAVARTMGVRESSISARIVNIALLREIEM